MKQLKLDNLKNKNHKKIIDNIIDLTEKIFAASEGYSMRKTDDEYEELRNKEIHKIVKILNKDKYGQKKEKLNLK